MKNLHDDEIIDSTPLAAAAKYFKDNVKGAPQKKIAAFVGISQPYISQLVNGDRAGNLNQWRKFAEFFGVEYADFYRLGEAVLEGFMLFPNQTPLSRVKELTKVFLKKYNDPYPGIEPIKAIAFRKGLNNWLSKNWKKPLGRFAKDVGITIEELKSLLDGSSIPDQDIVDDIVEVCGVPFSEIADTSGMSCAKIQKRICDEWSGKDLACRAIEILLESRPELKKQYKFDTNKILQSIEEGLDQKREETVKKTPTSETNNNIENFEEQKNAKHHGIINKFKNQELATKINEHLVEIEGIDPAELEEISDIIELKLNNLKKKLKKQQEESTKKRAANGNESMPGHTT